MIDPPESVADDVRVPRSTRKVADGWQFRYSHGAPLDASGNVLSKQTLPYAKSWGLGSGNGGTLNHDVIINDFTDLTPA